MDPLSAVPLGLGRTLYRNRSAFDRNSLKRRALMVNKTTGIIALAPQ
jgi:hypothetical protein